MSNNESVNSQEQDPEIINNLLSTWHHRAQLAQYSHFIAANRLRQFHYYLGIPSIILSTIVGTSVFASLSAEDTDTYLKILIGCISVLAAGFSGMQTFLKFEERAERHHSAGTQYGATAREIEQYIYCNKGAPEEVYTFLSRLRETINRLAETSPEIPQDIWDNRSKLSIGKSLLDQQRDS